MFTAPDTDIAPGGFTAPDTDADVPKSAGGLAENAVNNAGRMINPLNIAKGMGEQVKQGAFDLPVGTTNTLAEKVGEAVGGKKVQPVNESPLEKTIFAPSMEKTAADVGNSEPVQHPGEFAYKNPLDAAALVAAPVLGFLGDGAGALPKAGAESIAPEAAAEAPMATEPLNVIPKESVKGASQEAAEKSPPIPAAEPTPAAPAKNPPLMDEAVAKANEVKNYINKNYEGYAKKPGAAADVADYVQEKSQMMAAQQMGATPLQARQIGHEGMRALGQYALDNDIVSPTTGLKGMRTKTTALNNAAGETIGAVRQEADALRDPKIHSIDTLQQIKAKYDPVFTRGTRSGESGAYAKVLEELEDAKPTFEGMAELSTKLNKAANEANRLNQPHGVYTDIANDISHINNERIKALVGPQKAAQYEQALRDFGATKKIGEFLKRKEAGEVKRMGPGSLTSNLTQKALDEFGYRAGAKVANKLSTAIKRNPSVTKSIPSMFKEFINQVDDMSHEVSGMSTGGVVPHEIRNYVSQKGK